MDKKNRRSLYAISLLLKGGGIRMYKASAALITKAKSMVGKRFMDDHYEELLHKQNVGEIAGYLKHEASYHVALKDVRENYIHRGQLESILRRDLLRKVLLLFHYVQGEEKAFYALYLQQKELDLLLSQIRNIIAQNFEEGIPEIDMFLREYISFDLVALSGCKNYKEVLDVMKKSIYFDTLKRFQIKDVDERKLDYTAIENAVYQLYYKTVYQTIMRTYRGKTRRELLYFMDQQVELYNIVKIYRLKHFFEVNDEVIRDSLVFTPFMGNTKQIEKWISDYNEKELLAMISKDGHQILMKEGNIYIEHYVDHILFEKAKIFFRYSQSPPLVFASFIIMMQREINNLINIIEGVRYHVDIEEMKAMLIY